MKVRDLVSQLDLTVFCGEKALDHEVTGGYTCDLLSDVMGTIDEDQVWITLQTHKNVVAVGSLKDVAAVVIVKGLRPDDDALQQARLEGLPLLGTTDEAFEISGKIYQLLHA